MQPQSSNIAELPKVLKDAQQPAKPNPMTPKLKPPRTSQIVAAVIDCSPLITRKIVAEVLSRNKADYLADKVLACGEVDPAANPHEQFFDCMVVLEAISYGRKIHGITDPILVKAEGQEAAHFIHFSELAGVEMEL